ncbi:MAG: maleylpyruvate isomerase family mycothiol-dependent enzyme [Acidimicrobiales bacterium]
MEHDELIDHLRREGEVLGEVPLSDVDVPTCPGWTLPDLVAHVARVHRWQEAQVRAPSPDELQQVDRADPPPLDQLDDWYHTGLTSLVAALESTDPDHLTPTWFGPRPARFWARRAAHETAIHRWDAQAAVDSPSDLDPDQAIDALDELLEVLAPRRFSNDDWSGPEASIHLHATDVAGEWLIRMGPGGIDVTHVHEKGDVAARGSASNLMLMMAGRVPPARLELFGDGAMIDRWHRMVRL